MITNRNTDIEVISTLKGEKIGLSIDDDALVHIMTILTDLYSDPAMAVIREYSTNAYDAHVAAGNPAPIEITLPAPLAPFLRVRDYGVGMDAEDIRNTYSRYGASSKRNTNDQVGMLGLGCKSALTYTNQFTLVSVKDGIKTQVSISRDEENKATMTILDQSPTSEINGVEIIIPVKNTNEIIERAKKFFRFWKKGTVLVDGEEPEPLSGFWITPDLLMTREVNANQVVMGNVPYPAQGGSYLAGYSLVAFVPIGSVDFTPSREALHYTKLTQKTIADFWALFENERNAALSKILDDAPTRHEALTIYHQMANLFNSNQPITYKGEQIPRSIEAPADEPYLFISRHRYGSKKESTEKSINTRSLDKVVWLEGYDAPKFTPTRLKKLLQWAEEKNIRHSVEGWILCKTRPDSPWVNPDTIYSWADVHAQKLVTVGGPREDGRRSGSYETYADGAWQADVMAMEIDTTRPLYYTIFGRDSTAVQSLLAKSVPDFVMVRLTANRVNKFKRDFPQAKHASTEIQGIYQDWLDTLDEETKKAIQLETSYNRSVPMLSKLDETRVKDEDLVEFISVAKKNVTNLVQTNNEFARHCGTNLCYNEDMDRWLFRRYPILDHITYSGMDQEMREHVYHYVNAAYAASKEES